MAKGWSVAVGFVLGMGALAQTAPAPTPQQFAEQKLSFWQPRLKLDDWKISIVFTRLSDLPPKTLGGIRWDKSKKTAVIWVLDPADYQLPHPAMLDDMELTIVHELVHLDLSSLPRGQASRGSEERAVEGIAEAMLGLERGLGSKPKGN